MKKLSKILTPILLITAFLLVSCKDDVVTPPPPVPPLVDTVDYYNWYMDSIGFTMCSQLMLQIQIVYF